jgi:hypothetical protein
MCLVSLDGRLMVALARAQAEGTIQLPPPTYHSDSPPSYAEVSGKAEEVV